ncbi:MAG: hypothetical protein NT069_18575 [Planctomycetota bacterium]|nr:hypothetical protein [Planctomycetota bacterium]
MAATLGTPIAPLLGLAPATAERVPSTGNLALVPPFSYDLLLNTRFEDKVPLLEIGPAGRAKGWRGTPVVASDSTTSAFGVQILRGGEPQKTENQFAALGFGFHAGGSAITVANGSKAILTQELRNPRAGRFDVTVRVAAGGDVRAFRELLAFHFTASLVLFGYRELTKNLLSGVRDFAKVRLDLDFDDRLNEYREVTLSQRLRSQEDGANEIEMGVGLALILEKTSPGDLVLAPEERAWLCVDDVAIEFTARPRNDDVRV